MLRTLSQDQTPLLGPQPHQLASWLDVTPLLQERGGPPSQTPSILGNAISATAAEPTVASASATSLLLQLLGDVNLREALISFALDRPHTRTWALLSPVPDSGLNTIASLAGVLGPTVLSGSADQGSLSNAYRSRMPANERLATQPKSDVAPHGNSDVDRVLSAISDLVDWLGVTEEQASDLAGFSRRNVSNWRRGVGVYPKTVRSLFEIHALVGGLINSLGQGGMLSWLSQENGDLTRMKMLGSSEGRSLLYQLAQPLLFERAPVDRAQPEYVESELNEQFLQKEEKPTIPRRPPRRRRMPG